VDSENLRRLTPLPPTYSKTMADPSNEATGIQVFLRIRPPNRDGDPSHYKRDDINLNLITFDLPKKNADETVNNARSCYSFEFGGGIIDERCTQREIFKTVGIPSIDNALAGYNSTIFAYGQTGSGKVSEMFQPKIDQQCRNRIFLDIHDYWWTRAIWRSRNHTPFYRVPFQIHPVGRGAV